MTKQQEQRMTAKIYVFPTRPRMASGNHQTHAEQQSALSAPVVCGGSWYHQAAIEEEAVLERPLPYKKH
jgi:Protein of unknown function (DUF2735)